MEVKEVKLKRFVASDGKALKWRWRTYNYSSHEYEEQDHYAEREAAIDTNLLVSEVMEVSIEEYKEWYKSITPALCCGY